MKRGFSLVPMKTMSEITPTSAMPPPMERGFSLESTLDYVEDDLIVRIVTPIMTKKERLTS
jgi:hypothetical protein